MRLIDADAFTEQIAAAVIKKKTGEAAELGVNIIKLVDAQPTAYNVDAVVEELEKASDTDEYGKIVDLRDAIEIVKGGRANG